MEYRGYKIERERDHVVITAPDGESWTDDTMKDAMNFIDDEIAYDTENPGAHY